MQKLILQNLLLFFLAAICYGQEAVDSTRTEGPIGNVTVDSTRTLADSVFVDSAMVQLFDFRSRPLPHLRGLYRDSTLIVGSRYTSFGDVLDWLPGGYFANRGTSGQLAYGSLFGGPSGEFILEYDGLILNNPINGAADLNLVPVQSIGHVGVVHSSLRPFAFMPLGASVHIRPMSISNNPIRSQVGYRTGYYGYNDVDVRVGILGSSKLWIDFGGVAKNWLGIVPNQAYSGNKINFTLNRRIGADWLAKYVILFNQRDAQLPLAAPVADWPEFENPRQKDRRTDHSLQLFYKSRFKSILQMTKFEQDLHAQERSIFDERQDAYAYRWTNEASDSLLGLFWRAGLTGAVTFLNSNKWGKKEEWKTQAYASLQGKLGDNLSWLAGARFAKQDGFSPQALPGIHLFWTADSTARFSFWMNRTTIFPSLQARYANDPFSIGSEYLVPAVYNQLGLAGEKSFSQLFMHTSLLFQQRTNQIAVQCLDSGIRYANLPQQSMMSVNMLLDYSFLNSWRFIFKGDIFRPLQQRPVVANRPDYYFKTFVQYHLIKFKGDLNARLRLGAFVLGSRKGPEPFYAAVSDVNVQLEPAIYPYLHAVLLYRTAEIYVAYENYIDADVQYVYGYSMPGMWFRYGFIWHFVD